MIGQSILVKVETKLTEGPYQPGRSTDTGPRGHCGDAIAFIKLKQELAPTGFLNVKQKNAPCKQIISIFTIGKARRSLKEDGEGTE